MKVLLSWIALCGVLCGVAQASRPFPVGEPLRGVPQTNRNGRAPEGVEENLSLGQETRQLIQQGLRAEGFDPGAADGVFGPRTRAALRNWQAAHGRPTTGYLDRGTADTLQTAGAPRAAARVSPPTLPESSPGPEFTTDELASLDAAISEIDARIASSEQESALYASGLVKTMIELRLATLEQTREMLSQRKLASTYGVTVTYTVDGSIFTPSGSDQIAALEAEIAELEEAIATEQAQADRYSGGLVRAMALSTAATSRQSLAMLEQRRLALTYGLPQYVGRDTANDGAAHTARGSAVVAAPNVIPAPTIATQGPFGIAMGLSRDHVESVLGISLRELEGQPILFSTTAVPRSHPSFETYVLKILPTNGVCQVRGIGITIQSSSHGVEIRRAFNELAAMVSDAYGEYEEADFLLRGSIWDEPEDWMMALRRNERQLQAVWEGQAMPNSVASVILGASALSTSDGYLVLQYSFENEELCDAEERQLQRGVF